MTNPATPRRTEPAIGNGVATAFPFTFKVFSAEDIGVVRTLLATGVDVGLTLDVDYSVTLNPDQDASPGGTVTYPISGSPLSSSYSLTIFGDTDYTQDLDLSGGGNFNPVNIENALDRLSFQIQQLLEQLSRTLTLAVSSGSTTDLTLPSPVANGLIGWDSLAMGLQNVDPSTLATLVAYGTAQRDYFVGDGVTTTFALSTNPGALGNIDIDIDGVTQHGDTDFSWSGGLNLVFTTAPANLAKIQVRYLQALPVGTVGASTVGTTQLIDSGVTTVKLAANAVTTAKIADANVTNAKLAADAAFGRLLAVRVFTSNGTYTPTSGTNSVVVEAVGGGGGGGGCSATGGGQVAIAGGGGGGAYGKARFTSGFSGATLTIGAAGVGAAAGSGNGGNGGTTSFGALLSCPGGGAGQGGGAVAPGAPYVNFTLSPAAAPTGANIVGLSGTIATLTFGATLGSFVAGQGGCTPLGTGGMTYTTGVAAAGNGYGSGGSGVFIGASASAAAGASGAPGVIIVYEYA